ncbi:MAG: hypothetical protein ABJG78_02020 [Cyclobacteriaceae bacterium]
MKSTYLILLLSISYSALQAQSKMNIRVYYSVSGSELSVTFNDLEMLADKLEDSTAKFLNDQIPIFNFLPGGPASDTLFLELVTDGRSPLYDIILKRNFIGDNVDPACTEKSWTLNDSSHPSYNIKNRSPDIFVSNIMGRFNDLFSTEDFITRFFRNRRMTNDAIEEVVFDKKQWILVYSFSELPIGLQSELKFSQKYDDPNSGTEYRVFFAQVVGDRKNLIKVKIGTPSDQIIDANQARPEVEFNADNFKEVAGFWIVKYQPLQGYLGAVRSQ